MGNRVYVIQLASRAGPRHDPRLPWLYVGQSAKSPEERFVEHLDGGMRSSWWVRTYGLCLRPELYEDIPPLEDATSAEFEEHRRAQELGECGFVALSDGKDYSIPLDRYPEWDRKRVEPVIDYLDEAVFGVVARVVKPVTVGICAELLYGSESPGVVRQIGDVMPDYGRFAHVDRTVLVDRVNELVAGGYLILRGDQTLGFGTQA